MPVEDATLPPPVPVVVAVIPPPDRELTLLEPLERVLLWTLRAAGTIVASRSWWEMIGSAYGFSLVSPPPKSACS